MTTSWITRAETVADVDAIREVNLQAFGKTYEADVVEALRADPSVWLPRLSIVALGSDGEVVGQALLSRCQVDESPALALGPVAVLPAYQRQGVGGAVIRAGLSEARRRTASDGPPARRGSGSGGHGALPGHLGVVTRGKRFPPTRRITCAGTLYT